MNADKIDTQNGGNILVPSSNDNQEIDNGFLLAAQSYREKGWSIIPLQACEKVPDLRTWTSFQETAASEETISRWWEAKSNRNVGIVTGQVSGLIVLDVDGSDGEESLAMLGQVPTTPTVRTARGHHYYFKHPGGKLPIFAGRRPGIDFRGDGGYIVAPPSVHPDGSIYEWVVSPNDTPLADAPDWLLELVAEKGRPSGSGGRDLRSSVNDNESAGPQINYLGNGTFENVEMVYPGNVHGMELLLTAKAAYWNHHHYRDDIRTLLMSRSTAIEAVVNLAFEALARSEQGANWDRDQECETVTKMYDDAVNNWSAEWEAGSSSAKQGTARAQLIELTDGFEVWHTPNQEPFIKVPVGSHHENLRIDGNSFSYWLSREHYGRHKTSPSRQALEEATHQIIGHARFDGAEAPVHLRLGEHQGSIWIDLGNEDWSAVKVTSNGWRVFADAPIHFRRTAGMESLPIPVAGGSLDDLRPFLNVGTEDQFKFLVGWLLGALRPTGPFPILVINGEQGSGKSTLARVMRMLVDPNTLPIRSKPRGEQDLYIAANNGWVISLDNLSSVNDWLSDCLCRLATGGGFSTRKLYSDDDEILINVTCPIVINGIPDLLARSDLADRALVLELPRLEDGARQTEKEIWASFEEARPRIFGVLLDGISCALSNIDNVRLESPPRMADFAHWVVAAEPSLGWAEGDFVAAYADNRNDSIEVQLAGSALYLSIELLLGVNSGEWEGTASQLLDDLNEQTLSVDMATGHDGDLPTSARQLSNCLQQIAPLLRQRGIHIDRWKESNHGRARMIKLRRVSGPLIGDTDPEA